MISLVVILEIDPARVEEFKGYALEQAAASLKEPGCRRFEVSQKIDQANVFTLAELYDDEEAVAAHFASPHLAEWRQRTGDGIVVNKTAVRGLVL
jgi:(4S)-4-hydroxy-5-phosphonooxypentane-2,3-dione isomerase